MLDDTGFHKSLKIKSLIENTGAKLIYLPPYSPDLNPIEHYWNKIKNSIRKIIRNTNLLLDAAMTNVLREMSI